MKRASPEAWLKWREHCIPLAQAAIERPRWVVPYFLVPGLNLLAGEPKTMKSTLALCLAASVAEGVAVRNFRDKKGKQAKAERTGTVWLAAYEQGAGRLRNLYETRILRRPLKPHETHLLWAKSPWTWQLDTPTDGKNYCDLIRELKPLALIIDPWVLAHSMDENDAQCVKPLVEVREAAHETGTAVMLVHHMNKAPRQQGSQSNGGQFAGFDRVRGTSALWGLCDAGHLVTKGHGNQLFYTSDFKDFPGRQWTWRPP